MLIVIISIVVYYFPNSIPFRYFKCFFLTFIFCFRQLLENIKEKWYSLRGRSVMDCVRIYLNCARRWSLCGAKLFSVKVSVHILYYHKMCNLDCIKLSKLCLLALSFCNFGEIFNALHKFMVHIYHSSIHIIKEQVCCNVGKWLHTELPYSQNNSRSKMHLKVIFFFFNIYSLVLLLLLFNMCYLCRFVFIL